MFNALINHEAQFHNLTKVKKMNIQATINTKTFQVDAVCGADIAFNCGEAFLWNALEREGFRHRGNRSYDEALAAFETLAAKDTPSVPALNAAASLAVLYGLLAAGFHADNPPQRADYNEAYEVVKHEIAALL